METTRDAENLARAVRERRAQLGLRLDEVYARGGPATSTLVKIEAAAAPTYRRSTLEDLGRALGWKPGSVERVLRGEPPELQPDPEPATAGPRYVMVPIPEHVPPDQVEQARQLAEALVKAAMDTFGKSTKAD